MHTESVRAIVSDVQSENAMPAATALSSMSGSVGVELIESSRSDAGGFTVVVSTATLFASTGSSSVAVTVAVFVTTVGSITTSGITSIEMSTLALTARSPMSQVTTPLSSEHVPADATASTN